MTPDDDVISRKQLVAIFEAEAAIADAVFDQSAARIQRANAEYFRTASLPAAAPVVPSDDTNWMTDALGPVSRNDVIEALTGLAFKIYGDDDDEDACEPTMGVVALTDAVATVTVMKASPVTQWTREGE